MSFVTLFNDIGTLEFAQIATVATILISSICGLLSPLVVYRQRSYAGDTVTHLVFPGVVLGYIYSQYYVGPLWLAVLIGAAVTALCGAFFADFLARVLKVPNDAASVVTLTGFFAMGAVLLSQKRGLGINVERFLLGDVLTLTWADTIVLAFILIVLTVLLSVFRRDWDAWVADPEFAKVAGYRVSFLEKCLPVCLTMAVLGGLFTVGGLMISAMLALPAVFVKPRSVTSFGSLFVSILLGLIGLVIAFQFDMPVGSIIVLCGFVALAVKSFVRFIDNP